MGEIELISQVADEYGLSPEQAREILMKAQTSPKDDTPTETGSSRLATILAETASQNRQSSLAFLNQK